MLEALSLAVLVRYGQFFAAFGTARSQYTTSVRSRHPLTESMFVYSFATRRLKCPFHNILINSLVIRLLAKPVRAFAGQR